MRLISFLPEHLPRIALTERDRHLMSGFSPLPNTEAGPAFTLMNDETVIAVGGVAILWQGVGEAWILPSELVSKYPIAFHRAVKQIIKQVEEHEHLHRIQATVLESYIQGHRWIRRLGFKSEGKMPGYGLHGETFVRYARVRLPDVGPNHFHSWEE